MKNLKDLVRKYKLIIGKESTIAKQIFSKDENAIFLRHTELKKINYLEKKSKFIFFFIGNKSNSKKLNYDVNYLYPKKIVRNLKDKNCKLFFFGTQNEFIKFKNLKENYYGNSKTKLKYFLKSNYKNFIWIILPSVYSKKNSKGLLFYLKNSIKKKKNILIKNPKNKVKLGHIDDIKKLLNFLMLNFNVYKSKEIVAPCTKFLSIKYIAKKFEKKYKYSKIIYLHNNNSIQKTFFPKFKFLIKPKSINEYI